MATFGKTDVGGTSYPHLSNYIGACKFACPEVGTVTNISLYITGSGAGRHAQVALYNSAFGLVGASAGEEITVDGWHDFGGLALAVSAAEYWLAFNGDSSSLLTWYSAGATDQKTHDASNYLTWPNPLGPEMYLPFVYSIHADYTPSGGATVKKGSSLVNTMTEMLNSKMLFSACNRFPKLTTRRF